MTELFELNLRHLRALSFVVRHGGVRAAADAAGLSQPALTQAVRKVEHQLGTTLFLRGTNGMVATAAGETLVRRVDQAFAKLSSVTRLLSRAPGRGFARPENLFTTSQLRAFLSLTAAGSYAGAAKAIQISPAALHRAVRELEALCGTALVQRRGRGIVLTESGQHLSRGCRLAAVELASAIHEVRGGQALAGKLTVGAMPLSRAALLPKAIALVAEELAPQAQIDVVEGSYRELVELLRDGALDMMLGALREPPAPDLRQRSLFADRLIVTGRAGHPLASRSVVTLSELSRFPWVVGTAGTPMREQWEGVFEDARVARPSAPVECGSVMTIRGLLLDTDFLTLLSPGQIELEMRAGLLCQIGEPFADRIRTIGVTTRQDWQPTPLHRRFMELLDDVSKSCGNRRIA